ncbi:MAG: SlyX family protein [Gammaproteobacteria bacterium]|nr:SlyX family protein [Gammaproteobacteria bacterium]MBQ0839607.1 SlyX family protein [Gammaproteobacteria bacterium]
MSDQRCTELEIKLAYQEDVVKALNDVVCRQQKSIDRLEQTCRYLMQRVQEDTQSPVAEAPDQERPPHY